MSLVMTEDVRADLTDCLLKFVGEPIDQRLKESIELEVKTILEEKLQFVDDSKIHILQANEDGIKVLIDKYHLTLSGN